MKDLSQETMDALEDAAWTYKLRVDELIKKHTDEELIEFSGTDFDVIKEIDFERFARREAYMEVLYRSSYARAKPTMDRPDFSGIFCVEHDCDAKDCREQHDD